MVRYFVGGAVIPIVIGAAVFWMVSKWAPAAPGPLALAEVASLCGEACSGLVESWKITGAHEAECRCRNIGGRKP